MVNGHARRRSRPVSTSSQGTALGSQHLLDRNIDTVKLRSWLQEQFASNAQQAMLAIRRPRSRTGQLD